MNTDKIPPEFKTQKTKTKKRISGDGGVMRHGALSQGNTKYVTKIFAHKVEKLSRRGWATNRRVLTLDENHLCYYSKVPRKFHGDNHSTDQFANSRPKGKILLIKI